MSAITSFKPSSKRRDVAQNAPIVGQLVAFSSNGRALVEFNGAPDGACEARSILPDHQAVAGKALPIPVLLVFEANNLSKPVIIGVINDSPFSPEPVAEKLDSSATGKSRDVYVDGKKLVITGQEEILLKCGKSSILLRRDGKIVIKGENLISRSSLSNKIKGSSVSIN